MANGRPDSTTDGIRYYLPKPYVLVTELPVAPPAPQISGGPQQGGGGGGMNNSKDQSKDQTPQATTPTAPATDTSFSANMASYSVKLIYLPDYSHPMALQEESGLFGNVALAPNLQDGWMLTSLSSSNDSGGAAALAAVASLIGSAVGGGASGGGTKAVSNTKREAAVQGNAKNSADFHQTGGAETTHTTITQLKPIPPIWGENVLPAGFCHPSCHWEI